jgi:hypothetical protein
VLRKADGTGVFLTLANAAALTPGHHRFQLTFRRDNRIQDPDSPVLRQAGRADPEHVEVHVPWNTVL